MSHPTPEELGGPWYAKCVYLARLVRQLRAAQRSGGAGYKSAAAKSKAEPLEREVDDFLLLLPQ